jgi:acetyl esterase/lipase
MTRAAVPFALTLAYTVAFAAPVSSHETDQAAPMPPKANAQMQAVLDQHAKLGAKPLATLAPAEARKQPTPADAVMALLKAQGKSMAPEAVAEVKDMFFDGPAGKVPVRIYTPSGTGPFPLVLYIHGGGWVIADLDTYDASPRALANGAKAVVVSTHYRQGPENRFPAAHEDVLAAYQWMLANAKMLGGDAANVAVVGESAGGNMAANVALAARDQHWTLPKHQVLVYPVANNDMESASYLENANAKPLDKPAMAWFVKHVFVDPAQTADPRISLARRTDLAGLAPATIITAQIDPLRSEGEMLAAALKQAGVPVNLVNFDGVTHEFFGMAAAVEEAKQAQEVASAALRDAFSK